MSRHKTGDSAPGEQPEGWRSKEGQILVMFAAGLMLLLGMIAVSVDGGFIMAEKRQVQSAADAGALAAAKAKLDYLTEPANSQTAQVSAGKTYAAENADTSQDNVAVDTAPSPLGEDYVEVTVSKDVDMFFLRALYDGEWGVSATAIAGMEPVQLPYALVALECGPGNQSGISIDGSGTIDVNEGSIMSNCGIERSGDSNVVTADGAIDANGEIDEGSQWEAGQGIRENRPVVDDPIASSGVVPPDRDDAIAVREVTDVTGLDDSITNLSNVGGNSARCPSSSTCVMQPGYYGGNLTLDVRGTLEMEPGIYYFGDNFRLEEQTNSSMVRGTDVMLYFDDNSQFVPHNGRVEIEAPETSPYEGGMDGMALWIANCSDYRLQANNSGAFSGVIYAPCSDVTLSGGPGAVGMQVIVGSLTLAGTGGFDILYEEYVMIDVPSVFLVQ